MPEATPALWPDNDHPWSEGAVLQGDGADGAGLIDMIVVEAPRYRCATRLSELRQVSVELRDATTACVEGADLFASGIWFGVKRPGSCLLSIKALHDIVMLLFALFGLLVGFVSHRVQCRCRNATRT